MKLHQLQTLVEVVDQGSIRAAARRLNLSQAAVTKSMRLFEEEAGVPLLLRRSRGSDLTEAGTRLLARARLIDRQITLAQEELQQAAGADAGSLRVGLNPFVTLTVLGEAFAWFRQRYREVRIEFIDGLMQRVLPRLREGTLDLAVVAADRGEFEHEEFRIAHLQDIPQKVIVRSGHPALERVFDPAELAAHEWIFTRPFGLDHNHRASAMFAKAGVPQPRRFLVCDALQAWALQRNSDALSLMPAALLGRPETRGLVALDRHPFEPHDLQLVMLTRQDVPPTPPAEYFSHCVAQSCRGVQQAVK